jgi:N-acetylglucosaminyl-diphospho-decaprenol L-rhamnosyltransferase
VSSTDGTSRRYSVDVLVVSYNTRSLLEKCLNSVLAHQPATVDLGIRVFDNGSTDGTPEMLATRFPDVSLTRSASNEGFARANNRLASMSNADYLLLLNPDTVLTADVVGTLLDTLQNDARVAIAGPRLVYPDGRLQLSSQCLPTLRYELALPLRGTKLRRIGPWNAERVVQDTRQEGLVGRSTPRSTEFLWATCWLISRADAEEYGLFDDSFPLYDEDLDLCTRLGLRGRTIVYRPDVELIHIGGASSTSATKQKLMRSARAHYYRRYRGRLASWTYRLTVPLAWRARLRRSPRTPTPG